MKQPFLRVELFLGFSGDKPSLYRVLSPFTKVVTSYFTYFQHKQSGIDDTVRTWSSYLLAFNKNRHTTREMKSCPAAKDINPLRTTAADRGSSLS